MINQPVNAASEYFNDADKFIPPAALPLPPGKHARASGGMIWPGADRQAGGFTVHVTLLLQ